MKYPVTGLDEKTPWFFRVKAVNRWGISPPCRPLGPLVFRDPGMPRSEIENEEPTKFLPPETAEVYVEEEEPEATPGVPSKVVAEYKEPGVITVSFSEPADYVPNPEIREIWQHDPPNESNQIDGYSIEYAIASNDEDAVLEWTQVNENLIQFTNDPYPVSGLEDGVEYVFRVKAKNVAGWSDPSSSAKVLCSKPVEAKDEQTSEEQVEENAHYRGPPTAPEECDFRASYRDFIEVTWQPPRKCGGDFVNYYVEKSKLGSGSWTLANQVPTKFTQFIVNNCEMGEKYIFRVRAVNQFGTSGFSEPSQPVVAYDGIKPPAYYGPVQSFFRVALEDGKPCVTKNSIKVCWDAPQRDNGASVLGYHLEMRPKGGKFRPVNNRGLNQRHFTVDKLNENEGYQFRVRAFNIAGCSAWIYLPGTIIARDPLRPDFPEDLYKGD